MGRKKIVLDVDVRKAKKRINNKEIGLRAMARLLDMDHKNLSRRIDNLPENEEDDDKDIKPQTINKTPIKTPKNMDISNFDQNTTQSNLNKSINNNLIKPQNIDKTPIKKPHLSISLLRGLHELILLKSDRHKNSRNELLDIFIKEFQDQKSYKK